MISRSKPRRGMGGGETKSTMSVWTWEVILITNSRQRNITCQHITHQSLTICVSQTSKVDKHGGSLLGAEEYLLNIFPFILHFLMMKVKSFVF